MVYSEVRTDSVVVERVARAVQSGHSESVVAAARQEGDSKTTAVQYKYLI